MTFTIEVTSTVPPPAPGPDPLDVNGDGRVTVIDLAIVALFYGTQVPFGSSLPADVNTDGVVNLLDLTAVAQAIDAAGGGNLVLSLQAVEAALLAALAQAAEIEAVAEAPRRFNTPQRGVSSKNRVSNALAAVEHRATRTRDARLLKSVTVLSELHRRLTEMGTTPEQTALLPNYPNPFNPETWIPYQLAKNADVTLRVSNLRGEVVRTLRLGHQPAGLYKSRGRAGYWDGRNQSGEKVASGIYFYTLTAGAFTATRKLLIAK